MLGFAGFCWKGAGFCWVVLGCAGKVLDCSGKVLGWCWNFLGFAGFCWVLLGLNLGCKIDDFKGALRFLKAGFWIEAIYI